LSRKCWRLDISNPYGPSWPGTGIALPFSSINIFRKDLQEKVYNKERRMKIKIFEEE
jgi:hypothetical protein